MSSNPLEQRDVAITSNPADRLQTFHVTILDLETGDTVKTATHNYSIEECALHTKENLVDGYKVVEVFQPDSKITLNSVDIEEL